MTASTITRYEVSTPTGTLYTGSREVATRAATATLKRNPAAKVSAVEITETTTPLVFDKPKRPRPSKAKPKPILSRPADHVAAAALPNTDKETV